MQLYYPDKFKIEKMIVSVDNKLYEFVTPILKVAYEEKRIEKSVSVNILEFIKKCYLTIPYRKSKTEIRNIPYIIAKTSRGIEDNFLMFYRFIECYCKKLEVNGIRKSFIHYAIKSYYKKIDENEINKYTREIITLRNHYVHSGYYIKNSKLRVSKDPDTGSEAYTVYPIDIEWLYKRTKILYKICIEIIFSEMLDYSDYKFTRHF